LKKNSRNKFEEECRFEEEFKTTKIEEKKL
jgi:hypothetical protein